MYWCLSKGRRGLGVMMACKGVEGRGIQMPFKAEEGVWVYWCLSKGRRGFGCIDPFHRGGGGLGLPDTSFQSGGGGLGVLVPINGRRRFRLCL